MRAWWSARGTRTKAILVIVGLLVLVGIVNGGKTNQTTTSSAVPATAAATVSAPASLALAATSSPTAPPNLGTAASAAPVQLQRLQSVSFGGNNPEASSWSFAFCCAGSNPNSATAYRMWTELTPAAGGDATGAALLEYRKSVRQVLGWIVFPPPALADWSKSSAQIKTDFLRAFLNATHQSPAIITAPLDYYPNVTLVRYTVYTADGSLIATAEYDSASGANTINVIR
jgi:hypothetical protein